MSDISRVPTVIHQRCLLSPSLSYFVYPTLISGIHLYTRHYLHISLLLISFYSISVCDNFSYSLSSSCLFLCLYLICLLPPLISKPAILLNFAEPPISVCVQSFFALSTPTFLSRSLPVPHIFCHCWASCRFLLVLSPLLFSILYC